MVCYRARAVKQIFISFSTPMSTGEATISNHFNSRNQNFGPILGFNFWVQNLPPSAYIIRGQNRMDAKRAEGRGDAHQWRHAQDTLRLLQLLWLKWNAQWGRAPAAPSDGPPAAAIMQFN